MSKRRPVIGVMGGHAVPAEVLQVARELGAAIAAEGWILLTGGRDEGIMAAATQGARDGGGFVVGVHPGTPGDANPPADADLVIFTGIGFARNSINILSSDVVIALPGAAGTLSEVAYSQTYGKPTVLLGFDDRQWFGDTVARVSSVAEAIQATRALLTDPTPP